MALKDIYESWTFRPIVGGTNKTPRDQSSGTVSVDFLPNTYQTEVKNRAPGDKVVTQAVTDDTTNGTFSTTTAFRYYSTLFNSPLKTFKSRVVHLYNAQGTDASKYVTSNDVKDTPGALYISNS